MGYRTITRTILYAGGALAALTVLAVPALAKDLPPGPPKPVEVPVSARPIDLLRDERGVQRFGKLIWRGSLQLTSPSPYFGGYSGLAVDADGKRFAAVSDEGLWLTGTFVYRGDTLAGTAGTRTGALLGPGGKPLKGKRQRDAEAISPVEPGTLSGDVYIAFERNHRIGVFSLDEGGVGPAKRYLRLPARVKSANGNKGIEAIGVLTAGPARGALLIFTEEYLDRSGHHLGWLAGGKAEGEIRLKRIGGFAVTDLTVLPGGDVIVLERRFRFSEGVQMRLRRVAATDIKPGALLEGDVLFEADSIFEIDNMEGIAAHRDAHGKTVLTLISDDNFNARFQRTLLIQFELPEG